MNKPTGYTGATYIVVQWWVVISLDDKISSYELRHKLATADWPTASAKGVLKCPPAHLCGRIKERRINNLNPSTTYHVQLRACAAGGCGPWSGNATFTTLDLSPDRVPQFTHDSRTYTGAFGTELSVILDRAAGGDRPLRYSLANDSKPDGSDTDGSLDTNTRVLTISPDAFGDWVYTLTAVDQDGDIDSQTVTVSVPEPEFTVTINNQQVGDGDTHQTGWRSWLVSDRVPEGINDLFPNGDAGIDVTVTSPTADMAAFEFRLVVNSVGTGLHILSDPLDDCQSANKQNTSDWESGNRYKRKVQIPMTRCELGHGSHSNTSYSSTVELEARIQRPNDTYYMFTLDFEDIVYPASHRESLPVTYGTFVEPTGTRHEDWLEDRDFQAAYAIRIAADAWNNIRPGLFAPADAGDIPDMSYTGSWRDGNHRCRRGEKVSGCASIDQMDSRSHLTDNEIWILFPARYESDEVILWTTDLAEAKDPEAEVKVLYLPQAVMHEMGHTLGIGHIPDRRLHLMSTYMLRGRPITAPTPFDIELLNEVLAGQH